MSVADSEEIDALYRQLADVTRAIGQRLPEGADAPETLTAGIQAVADHAFAQGAAHAAAQIADALDPTPDHPDHRGPYFFTEAEWDRLSGLFLANSDVGLGSDLDQAIFSKLVDAAEEVEP